MLRQRQIGNWWGAVKITYTYTAIYVNACTFLLTAMVFYRTTLSDWMISKLGWQIGIIPFMAIIVAAIVVFSVLIEYRMSMPSVYRFDQDQRFIHSKIYRETIEGIRDEVKEVHREIRRSNRRPYRTPNRRVII